MIEDENLRIYTTIMRAGTSKGIFLNENDLPSDPELRDKVILEIFGSPDLRQIDGLGGADNLTSKLALIGPPTRDDADVDYTFGQVEINEPIIHYTGLCGNISSGVGNYAIEEGLVRAVEPITKVRVHSKNTNQIYEIEVKVKDGRPITDGDFHIDGVPGTGAEIVLNMAGTVGSVTGKLLPTGNPVDILEVDDWKIEASLVDMVNPVVFVRAKDLGLRGDESPSEFDVNHEIQARIEKIRAKAAEKFGMKDWTSKATTPFLVFVSEKHDYNNYLTNTVVSEDTIDFIARMVLMGKMHKTYAGSVSCNTGIASLIKGSIVNQVSDIKETKRTVRIGHPSGIVVVEGEITYEDENIIVNRATYSRTARRLMDGYAYVQKSRLR
jgi:2-methylaconitate cis-trans-isomerase PrpF